MSELENKAVDILDKLDALTTQYAPDVIDKAVQSVVITGVSDLVYGFLGFIAMYFAWVATNKIVSFFVKKKKEDGFWSDWEIGYFLAGVIGGVISFSFGLTSIWTVFSVWTWTAIFNPELAMAHKLLGL